MKPGRKTGSVWFAEQAAGEAWGLGICYTSSSDAPGLLHICNPLRSLRAGYAQGYEDDE